MLDTVKTLVPANVKQAIKKTSRSVTGAMRVMPNFLVIGAQKCGTTALYHYLIEHPYIVSASRKQMHFFDNNFDKGLTWYRTHFPTYLYKYYFKRLHKHDFLTCEATPYYIFHPLAAKRVAQVLPDAKFILLIRNPVSRAYSHYNHEKRKGTETLSFEEALDQEATRLAGEQEKMLADENYYSFNHQRYAYQTRGIYADQLIEWFKYFPQERFLILRSEDMYSNILGVVNQILEFLQVPYDPNFKLSENNYYNVGQYDKMAAATKQRLEEFFKPHNQRLYKLLGRDLGW